MLNQDPVAYGAHRDLSLAMDIGELMLKYGCETARVETTVDILLNNSDYCLESDSLVLTTGIFATITDKNSQSHTMIKRVKNVSSNLTSIAKLNELSRLYVTKQTDYEAAKKLIEDIRNTPVYPKYIVSLFCGVTSMFFCYMKFLSPLDALMSFIAAFIAYTISVYVIEEKVENRIMQILITSIVVVFFSVLTKLAVPSSDVNSVVIGGILPLVPGTETITGMRDIMEGNFLAATARLLNAIIIGVSIAVGVGISLGVYMQLGGLI